MEKEEYHVHAQHMHLHYNIAFGCTIMLYFFLPDVYETELMFQGVMSIWWSVHGSRKTSHSPEKSLKVLNCHLADSQSHAGDTSIQHLTQATSLLAVQLSWYYTALIFWIWAQILTWDLTHLFWPTGKQVIMAMYCKWAKHTQILELLTCILSKTVLKIKSLYSSPFSTRKSSWRRQPAHESWYFSHINNMVLCSCYSVLKQLVTNRNSDFYLRTLLLFLIV